MWLGVRFTMIPQSKPLSFSFRHHDYLLIALVLLTVSIALCDSKSSKQILISRNPTDMSKDGNLISKCCPLGHGLWKMVDLNATTSYVCLDPVENTVVTEEPLMTFVPGDIQIGFPDTCEGLPYRELELSNENSLPFSYCLDKIILEEQNNESISEGAIVVLTCEEQPKYKMKPNVVRLRKCCRNGMVYDTWIKACRNVTNGDDPNSTKVFERFVHPSSNLLDVNFGLNDCNNPKFAVDYLQDYYEINLHGTDLTAKHRNTEEIVYMNAGTFCIDGTVDGTLVARGCRENCDLGICITKCCAEDETFIRNDCTRGPKCTKIDEISDFVPEFYEKYNNTVREADPPDTYGVRYGVMCAMGKFKVERNVNPLDYDYHYIDRKSGYLIMPHFPDVEQKEYCVEKTDQNACGLGTSMETLICFTPPKPENKFTFMSIGAMISCVFLFMTILVYAGIPELRNLHGKTLMCHAIAMLSAYACLAWVQSTKIYTTNLCIAIGYTIYFSFVSAFCWLNIMCFDIWWTFGSARTIQIIRKPEIERRRFIYYSLYAWGLSLLLTGITIFIDFRNSPDALDPDIGLNSCWFGSTKKLPHYILFVLPMGLQILTNCVLFILTAIHCNKVKSEIHRLQAGSMGERCKRRFLSDKAKYTLNLKLFVVMGVTWFWEFVSNLFTEPEELWYVADFLNLLQGVPIFCILVLKRKVFRLIRKKLGCEKEDKRQIHMPSGSTTTTGISSGSTSAGYKNGRLISTSSYGSDRNSGLIRNPTMKSLTVTQENDVITLRTS